VPIASTDLIAYAAANIPADDTALAGGAIDILRRIDFTQIAAADRVEVVSANAGDTTQTATVTGRLATGALVIEALSLNGTTPVLTAATLERVLKVELSASCVGTVTVRRQAAGATVRTIPPGERGFMAAFRQLASNPSAQTDFYAKFFWLNNHGTLSLVSAQVAESADPDNRITHALAAAIDDTQTVANRTTSPGIAPDDNTTKTVPGNDLAAGSKIGVWLHLQLPAADTPHNTTYTSQLSGQSI
jgi:hypothetical protein